MTDDLAEAKRHIRALIDLDDDQRYAEEPSDAYLDAMAFLSRLDAEGQTVEGGDEDERRWLVYYHDKEVPPELFARGSNAEECARKRHANQLGAWSCHLFREVFPGEQVASAAELTRLKAAQPEHDRTVRLATLEEAAALCERIVTGDESTWDEKFRCGFDTSLKTAASGIRSLIDQTGGEGGNG